MMRSWLTGGLALCAATLVIAPAMAQDAAQSAFLTIDQDRVFSASLYGKRVATELEQAVAELSAENRRIEADLTAEERALTERRPSLTPDAFRPLADAFDAKVQGIRAAQDAKSRALSRQRDEERQTFFNRALPILADLVRERGAVAILDRRAIFISVGNIDITDAAIDRIDAALGDGAATDPQPAPEPEPAPEPQPAPEPEAPPAESPQAKP